MNKNYFVGMQKGFLALTAAALLFSCSSIEPFDASELVESQESIAVKFKNFDPNARVGQKYLGQECGTPLTSKLLAAQNIPVGEVSVFNVEDKFYVTVSIEKGEGFDQGDWFIQKIHGYFGQVEFDFVTKGKKGIVNPAPGQFPINESIIPNFAMADQEYTFELELSDKLRTFGEFDVAIHAEVVKVENIRPDVNGNLVADVIRTEGAWADGQRFNPAGNGNWSTYMSYTVQECAEDVCNPNWNRGVSVTGNNWTPEVGELNVTYQINDVDQGRVGEVTIVRSGSKNANDGFTFTMTFKPDSGVDFKNMETCISAAESGVANCSTTTIKNVNGSYTMVINNAPFTPTGSNAQAASSWVKVSVESDKCD